MASVTVTGASSGIFTIPYASSDAAGFASPLAALADQAINSAQTVRFTLDGSPLPNVPAGQQLVLYETAPFAVTLPDTVPATLFSNATGVTTVTSGAISGDKIVVGDGGLNFTAGQGIFNLVAGNGDATLGLAPGVGGGAIFLGDGNATVNAIGGNNSITAGAGNHIVTLGIGRNTFSVAPGSNNTVTGGPGNMTVSRGYNSPTGQFYNPTPTHDLILLGSGNNLYFSNDEAATATLASSSGSDTINAVSTGANVYFAGSGTDYYTGAGTVVGGSGTLLAQMSRGGMLFGGSGSTQFAGYTGTSTVAGNPSGNMTVQIYGTGSVLLFAQGLTQLSGGSADTVLGIGGALSVTQASGLFLAAPGGGSQINVIGNATVFGVAAGDVLSASDPQFSAPYYGTATSILVGGAGAETISGAGGTANMIFFAGSGPEFIQAGNWSTSIVTGTGAETIASGTGTSLTAFIQGRHPDVVMQGFDAAKNFLTLINYGTGEAAAAVAGAQVVAGSEVLTLSDGTHITFQGVTGITAATFL